MKNHYLLIILISFVSQSQNSNSSYQTIQPLEGSIEFPSPQTNLQSTVLVERNAEERRQNNIKMFRANMEKAEASFKNKDFKNCIYLYEQSKNLWKDSYFQYIAGVSYFEIWKQLKVSKYKKLSKELLKLSDNNGYVDANIFLKENF